MRYRCELRGKWWNLFVKVDFAELMIICFEKIIKYVSKHALLNCFDNSKALIVSEKNKWYNVL